MAGQFCVKCGKQLPTDAPVCPACGEPVALGSAMTEVTETDTAQGTVAGSTAPPLGVRLGLEGCRNFLLQHELLSGGRNYRVLAGDRRHLFTVREDVRQELEAGFLGGEIPRTPGHHLGQGGPLRVFLWSVADPSGTSQGAISVQLQGTTTVSTLTDDAGTAVLAVKVERGSTGLAASAAHPDGRPMYAAYGDLLRRDFLIKDPAGSDVAKIHEAWASMRDTYNLDLLEERDPLFPIIFAILIDREKAFR